MDLFKKFRKCRICGNKLDEKGNKLKYVPQWGIYGQCGRHYAYHSYCIKEVLRNPKEYGHNIVDKALQIIELLEKEKNKNNRLLEQRKEQIKKAQNLLVDSVFLLK